MTGGQWMGERVAPTPDVLVQHLPDGDSVLLHMGREVYFSLDVVGTTMWQTIAAGMTVPESVAALGEQFDDVDASRLEADFRELIAQLLAAGLVEVHDE